MNIQEITLLTSKEYREYKHLIPEVRQSWFLRDTKRHGAIVFWSDGAVHLSPEEKKPYYVRPALRIQDLEATVGEQVEIFAYKWTVLANENNEAIVLCDEIVTYRKYGDYDKWEGTSLHKWLNAWLKKRLSFTKPEQLIRHKKMNNAGMYYQEHDILSFWLTSMLLVLPISAVLIWFAWTLKDCEAPIAFYGVVRGLGIALGLINLLDLALIVFSPHTDTWWMHVINILLLAGALVFGFMSTSAFNMTIICVAILVWMVNYRYFKKIKYYS